MLWVALLALVVVAKFFVYTRFALWLSQHAASGHSCSDRSDGRTGRICYGQVLRNCFPWAASRERLAHAHDARRLEGLDCSGWRSAASCSVLFQNAVIGLLEPVI